MDIAFPLLRLPNTALFNVLDSMDHGDLLDLSFLSKKCRDLVISLKLKANVVKVFVTESLEIMVTFSNGDDFIYVFNNDIWISLRDVEDIIDHFKTIFHNRQVGLEFGADARWSDLEWVNTIVGHVHLLCLASGDYGFNRTIVNLFKPDGIFLYQDAFRNGGIPERILIQNLSELRSESTITRLSLDDLLITNSVDVYLNQVTLTGKDINRFIKLWRRGSNPRLESLQLRLISGDDVEVEEMWKGVKYQDIPLHEKRLFKCLLTTFTMEGGRDIHRVDGTKATCFFFHSEGFVTFSMFVWKEHCKTDGITRS